MKSPAVIPKDEMIEDSESHNSLADAEKEDAHEMEKHPDHDGSRNGNHKGTEGSNGNANGTEMVNIN